MYCQQVHPSSSSTVSNTTVIEETFLDSFSTSCVNPFEKKGRQKVGSQVEVFNKLEYFELMNNPTQKAQKPCGYSLLNQYHSAILDLHAMQKDNGCNNVPKDELMSDCIKRLLNNVKKRKLMVAKINFEEKLIAEFALYTTVKEVPRIEEYLFQKNSFSTVYGMATLQDRYCWLMSTNGILQEESLFKYKLSDLCDLVHDDV